MELHLPFDISGNACTKTSSIKEKLTNQDAVRCRACQLILDIAVVASAQVCRYSANLGLVGLVFIIIRMELPFITICLLTIETEDAVGTGPKPGVSSIAKREVEADVGKVRIGVILF